MASERTGRIAKNTFIMYVQMLFGLLIGLYTSRVVLYELGVEDYGIYNVVGGIVMMFGLLNSSMSSTSSRFITVALGKANGNEVKEVFGMSLSIHILLAMFIVLTAEPVGLWFLENKMQIPPVRMEAALWVFQCSIATAFVSLLNVPYNSLIIAHERMNVYAYFSLLDLLLRLLAVFLLPVYGHDKLKFYATLILGIQVLMQSIYWIYCLWSFREARILPLWNKVRFKQMSSFAGWSLFGDGAALMFTQGLNILLNVFFGPTVNAARGIAVQVQGVVGRFIGSFQTAVNPQLFKSHASKDYAYMHRLIYASSKFSFFLFLLLAMPLFFETRILLTWWLEFVPEYTVTFIRIILLISLIDCLSNPLVVAAKATGYIKKYQFILGLFLLTIVPISYVFLSLGYPPASVFVVHLVIALIGHSLRVILIKPLINLDMAAYFKEVILKTGIILTLSPILPVVVAFCMEETMLRFFTVFTTAVFSTLFVIWGFGLKIKEKELIRSQLRRVCF